MEQCRLHQLLAVVTINSLSDLLCIMPSVEYWLCIPGCVYEQMMGWSYALLAGYGRSHSYIFIPVPVNVSCI